MTTPETEPLSIRIDDRIVPWPAESYTLGTGLHSIHISGEGIGTFTKEFHLEAGEEKVLAISLLSSKSRIILDTPDGTDIRLDGDLIKTGSSFHVLEAGHHTIMFTLGEYQISREFNIQPGEDLSISLLMDVSIQKN